ncbi:MAG: LamG-like jellyroll fold domain-containing protein [Chthoniobacteraceae bacterium]
MLSFHSMKVLYTSLALSVLGAVVASAATVLDLESANYNTVTHKWMDASLSANNASGGAMPVILNATPTGQSALDFSKGNYLALTDSLSSAAFTTLPTFTIFFVAQENASSGIQPVLYGDSQGSLGVRLNSFSSTALSETVTKISITDVGTSSPATSNVGYHLYTVVYDKTNYSFYIDGVLTGSGTKTLTFTAPTKTFIGYNGYGTPKVFSGQIAALVVHDTALSSTDIATMNTRLINLYLISEPATSGHR